MPGAPKRGRVTLEGIGMVIPDGGKGFGRPLLLEVPDCNGFTITVRHTEGQQEGSQVTSLGIMPHAAPLTDINLNSVMARGFFMDLDSGNLYGQDGTWDKASGVIGAEGLSKGQEFHLRFRGPPEPALLGALDEGSFRELKFNHPIPAKEYRPCLLLSATTSVEVTVERPEKRRRTELANLWEERRFTDAEVVCAGEVFPVHRAVLAAASPVFAATFGGQMREASTCRVDILDASVKATEALLRHVYTGQLEAGQSAEVLPLAHRYQLGELVALCGRRILDEVTPESVANIVRLLRSMREDAAVAPIWRQALATLDNSKELRHAALESL